MIIREAREEDMESILKIYNEGIVDRIATLELETKDITYIRQWLFERSERYEVIVAEVEESIAGWASLNPYSHRCAYNGVADLSVYIQRKQRGKGIGKALLKDLEDRAKKSDFHKLVLFTFPFNQAGQGLYKGIGFREVGVFQEQGKLDNKYVDVMAMEKILT